MAKLFEKCENIILNDSFGRIKSSYQVQNLDVADSPNTGVSVTF